MFYFSTRGFRVLIFRIVHDFRQYLMNFQKVIAVHFIIMLDTIYTIRTLSVGAFL